MTSPPITHSQEPAASPPGERPARTATLHLPFVTAEFRMPEPRHLPGAQEVTGVARGVASFLPPPRRLAYYTGLGLAAAFQVIEWPVAVAIGAGTAIAGAGRRPDPPSSQGGPAGGTAATRDAAGSATPGRKPRSRPADATPTGTPTG